MPPSVPHPTSSQPAPSASGSILERASARTARLAAIFCVVVCGALLVEFVRIQNEDPVKSPRLAVLREKLVANPKDDSVRRQIRSLDLELRQSHFRRLFLNSTGAWLAAAGFFTFLISKKRALRFHQQLPMPQPQVEAAAARSRAALWSRRSVAGIGAVAGISFVGIGLASHSLLPESADGVEHLLARDNPAQTPLARADFASASELEQNWPRFRGPGGCGVSAQTNAPLSWDVKTGRGVLWKAEIPRPGFNSPIVWGDRVFLSGGDATNREVFCFEATTGRLAWRRAPEVPGPTRAAPKVPDSTGYAAPTMATDGRRAYVIFASGDLAAFSLEGKQIWATNVSILKNPHGHASSLLTWQDRLIVQVDQGEAAQQASRLYAFEGATGRAVWQRVRPMATSWASPILIEVGGQPQIITEGIPWTIAYAAKDGKELWRAEGLENEVTPSPILAGGLVCVVSPNEKVFAIKPDGQGDVSKTHLVWTAEDNIPDISSPVGNSEFVFTLSTPGMLTCYDVKDGKKVWEQDLGLECNASPSLVGNRLYAVGTKGVCLVSEVGRQFKELARSDLGEKVFASPAFAAGKMFLRGEKHLFCVGPQDLPSPMSVDRSDEH